jgi:hypothetical protein
VFRDSFDVSGLEGARRFCSLCLRQAKAIAASAVEVHALRRTQFMVGKCAADAQAYLPDLRAGNSACETHKSKDRLDRAASTRSMDGKT